MANVLEEIDQHCNNFKSSNNGKALIYNLISYFTARCRINYNDYTVFPSDP
jgi:hypothetical protein